jgi:hypothetical protein
VFVDGQGLAARERTVERGMFGQVADDHVAPAPGQALDVEVRRGEPLREAGVQRLERAERVEHLPVSLGGRRPARDDVAAVRAVPAGRVDELAIFDERPVQRPPEPDSLPP